MSVSNLFDREKSYVLWLLGRREYSCDEVRRKLKNRGNIDLDDINNLLDYVIESGWFRDRGGSKDRFDTPGSLHCIDSIFH